MQNEFVFFGGFLLFILIMLSIDLGLFHKKDAPVSFKQAGIMSFIWVSFAIGFYFILLNYGQLLHGIYDESRLAHVIKNHGHKLNFISGHFTENLEVYKQILALEFITGYVVEYALSVDNIFVIVLIFTAFGVHKNHYHRVLFWGIIGAVIMRFIFIFLGAALIEKFEWILYVFGGFLVYTGAMLIINKDEQDKIDPKNHKVVKFASKYFAVFPGFAGDNFFIKQNGKTFITTLFLVLLIVEFTDLVFAIDSIPAIFVVTRDPYIVFFSNIFAILGLRSMFFLLINVIHRFHYLKFGLAVLLMFIGTKMLAHKWLEKIGFSVTHSLIVILAILASSVILSLLFSPNKREENFK